MSTTTTNDTENFSEHDEENQDYNDAPLPIVAPKSLVVNFANVREVLNPDGTKRRIIKARKSTLVSKMLHLNGAPFSFEGRNYLLPIYDGNDRNILLKTGRQVEKCEALGSKILLSSGIEKNIEHIVVGDVIASMNAEGKYTPNKVLASDTNGDKCCLKIRTRLGSVLTVTENHPLRKLLGWTSACELKIGDKIASLRTMGCFGLVTEPLAGLLGMVLGDGSMTEQCQKFTCKCSELQKWYETFFTDFTYSTDKRSGTRSYTIRKYSDIAIYFKTHEIYNKTATEKILPTICFEYDFESTRELIRGLWATDGHCKNTSSCKIDLVYCSSSEKLIRQVIVLLRKFGIITTCRTYQPKKGNLSWIIRVVTRKSIEAFHKLIGPIPGKPFTLCEGNSNSNLDTLPKEVNTLFKEKRKLDKTHWTKDGLLSKGLRQAFGYCPTYEKTRILQEHIQEPTVQWALDSDIIWDEIVFIKSLGILPTWGIQTENNTYVSDLVVSHNTTFLGNNLVIDSAVIPYNKALYVSPSHTQTRQFSNEKLRPVIDQSPLIKTYLQDHSISTNVMEKGFTNGSYIFLRSAFRSADRTRGISARNLFLDEVQDYIGSEIPVIMECTSHFEDARILMAGTPKSFDNPIEDYWQESTQCEWLVPCYNHSPVYWNFLDEKNIGPTADYVSGKLPPGPICKRCGRHIDPRLGQWMTFAPGKRIKGYRISQLQVSWIIQTYDQWLKLLWKRDNYPFGQLYNEVLGLSFDNASKPITRDELIECCDPHHQMLKEFPTVEEANWGRGRCLIGGVDWGEGNDGSDKSPTGKVRHASYTVFTIGMYADQKNFKVMYVKKYIGQQTDPDFIVRDITRLCMAYDVKLVGVDWGHGWGVNNQLVRMLGPNKVVQFQYMPKIKYKMKWDPIGFRYQLQRNLIISELFFMMKDKRLIFPAWKVIEPYAKDILAVFVEYVEYRREMKYDHKTSDPDDWLHSLNYSVLAANIYHGKVQRV